MRTIQYIAAAVLSVFLVVNPPAVPKVNAQPGVAVSFQVFFNSLSPFGRWSNHPAYGSIWFPNVGRDFHPYATNGRWVMTEFGNTWVSDYDWGWAPFHYGRWFYDDFYGWAWVPDYVWGPGWVNWRTGGGYYGWAPLMPGLQVRISVNIPLNFWIFVPHRHFMSANWYRYSAPRARVQNVYYNTTVINNYYVNGRHEYSWGPRRAEIERYSRNSVPVYDYSRSGDNGRYKEVVSRNNRSNHDVVTMRERGFEENARAASRTGVREAVPGGNTSVSPDRGGVRTETSRSRERVYSENAPAAPEPGRSARTDYRHNAPAPVSPSASGSSRVERSAPPAEHSSPRPAERSSTTQRSRPSSESRSSGARVQAPSGRTSEGRTGNNNSSESRSRGTQRPSTSRSGN